MVAIPLGLYNIVTGVLGRLKSTELQVFLKQLIQANNKEKAKAHITDYVSGEPRLNIPGYLISALNYCFQSDVKFDSSN